MDTGTRTQVPKKWTRLAQDKFLKEGGTHDELDINRKPRNAAAIPMEKYFMDFSIKSFMHFVEVLSAVV